MPPQALGPRRRLLSSGRARRHQASRQSSIHHLSAGRAGCQPADLRASRRRHGGISNDRCDIAPIAADAAACGPEDTFPVSGPAVLPAAVRSIPPDGSRVRAGGPAAAAPAPLRRQASRAVRAGRFRQAVPRTRRPGASLPRISAALRLRSTRRVEGEPPRGRMRITSRGKSGNAVPSPPPPGRKRKTARTSARGFAQIRQGTSAGWGTQPMCVRRARCSRSPMRC